MEATAIAQTTPTMSKLEKAKIFWTLMIKGLMNFQTLTIAMKRFSANNQEKSRNIRGYVPNLQEMFDDFSVILSDISGIEIGKMKLFFKEYAKDHLKNRLKPESITDDRKAEILIDLSINGIDIGNIEFMLLQLNELKKSKELSSRHEVLKPTENLKAMSKFFEKIVEKNANVVDCTIVEFKSTVYEFYIECIDQL